MQSPKTSRDVELGAALLLSHCGFFFFFVFFCFAFDAAWIKTIFLMGGLFVWSEIGLLGLNFLTLLLAIFAVGLIVWAYKFGFRF